MTEFEKYTQRYLDLIPGDNWLEEMEKAGTITLEIYSRLTDEQSNFSYADGKWSLKVLLQHMIDAEKIFNYRALRFSRNDKTELPGWDEVLYGENNNVSMIRLNDLMDEFETVRKMSILFFKNLDEEILHRTGIANGQEISVENIGKLIVGHNIHHLNIIKERYISSF